MLFTKINSPYSRDININSYLIDWNKSPSKEQQVLQDFLKPYWKNKVILAEFMIPGSRFRVDLMNITDRIAIEYSPSSTHDFNKFFHVHPAMFKKRVKSDLDKIKWLQKNNFQVLEVVKDDLIHLSPSFFLSKFGIQL